jgi:hypothetical protein
MIADWRQAIRSLRRSPTFAATAIATLAFGIGATSAIFTIVNAALFKPLPYPNPEELVVLTTPSLRASTGQLFLFMRDRGLSWTPSPQGAEGRLSDAAPACLSVRSAVSLVSSGYGRSVPQADETKPDQPESNGVLRHAP